MSRHNVWIPDRLWLQAERAAHRLSLLTGRRVSVSELIRRGLETEVAGIARRRIADPRVRSLQEIETRIGRLLQVRDSLQDRLATRDSSESWGSAAGLRARVTEVEEQIRGLEGARAALASEIVRGRAEDR